MSSGILRISFRTSPDSFTRSCSFWLSANARGRKAHAKSIVRSVFMSCLLLMNVHAAVNLNDWATDDDPARVILIVVIGTALINVSLTTVLLGLARRQPAVSPTGLLSATPSRRVLVVSAVFVSITALPALIVVLMEVLVSMLVFFSLVLVICHKRGRAQAECSHKCKCCQKAFAHTSSTLLCASIMPCKVSLLFSTYVGTITEVPGQKRPDKEGLTRREKTNYDPDL